VTRTDLPDLSRFELQCLRRLWELGDASVKTLHESLTDPPTYSTVRKIVERLEEKGAVRRVGKEGKAWIYRSMVSRSAMVRKEVRRFLDVLFDGSAAPLVSQLAEMDELTLEDLQEVEQQLERGRGRRGKSPGR
jgi:BlaI family penicillinase repressor